MRRGPARCAAGHVQSVGSSPRAARPPRISIPALPVFVCLLAVGCGGSPPDIPAAAEARGSGVVVTCAVSCGGAHREALPFAEEARAVASDLFGVEPGRIGRIHLARGVEEYEALEARATGGRFRANLAFSKPEWALSVIAIQPTVDSTGLARTGLPMQTLRLVAHEASHLVSYTMMPPPRRVPGWLEEGLAIHVETAVRERRNRMGPDLGEDPFFSTYLWRMARAEAEGRLPTVSELLADRVGDLAAGEGYAARGVLFRGLVVADPEGVRAGLRAATAAHADGGGEEELTAAFVEAFGGEDRVSRAFTTYLRGSRPAWRELGRTLETGGEVWRQHAFPSGAAHAVRLEPSGPRWTLAMRVRAGDGATAAVTLHDDVGLHALIRIGPDEIALVRHEPREVLGRITTSRSSPNDLDPGGVGLRLAIEGSTVGIRSDLGDMEPIDLGTPLSGPWGLLVEAGGWAEWANVTFVR